MKTFWYIDEQSSSSYHAHAIKNLIADVEGIQNVTIAETYSFGRVLIIDQLIQSAEEDEYIYHESLVHPAMLASEDPKRVLIIGAGEGATIREVLKYDVKEVVAVDIDKKAIEVVEKYLESWHNGSFKDPRVKLVFQDGFKFVKEYTGEPFDVVILDLTDPTGTSQSRNLYTLEFYKEVKRLVKDVMVTQGTSPYQSPHSFSRLTKTLTEVYRYVSVGLSFIPSFDTVWAFIFCSDKFNIRNLDVKNRIGRVKGELKYYDEITHKNMFFLPKDIRGLIEGEKTVATLSNPLNILEE
ncbi:spermidine synthase [Stygiolobus caldivivus]|uniref:Polyamine aminopropyltransferase n=1 Tax=Stygiolobus caldivivus TaxID=2824673 RepID=A0A8D5U4C0_9CREN|nr:spermidine synthase [Stygiolobus caldivivus]BCU69034.1 spermidine synthase [Stygiolobus caldivivus]